MMNKRVLPILLCLIGNFLLSQSTPENKPDFDKKQELVYDGKRYRVWHNYITGGGMPGGTINNSIPTSQTCAGLDFNFHIQKEYFQAGVLISGNVFGDWNNTGFHLCWGKKIERNKYLFAAYGGVDYSLFYQWQEKQDSIPARFVTPAVNQVGAYASIQNYWKIKYDVGIGCNLFCSYNYKRTLFGIRMELFFSSAFRGDKGRRKNLAD